MSTAEKPAIPGTVADPMKSELVIDPTTKLVYDDEGNPKFVQINPQPHSPETGPYSASSPVYFLSDGALSKPDLALLKHQQSLSKVPAVFCRVTAVADRSSRTHTMLIDDTVTARTTVQLLNDLLRNDSGVVDYRVRKLILIYSLTKLF